MLRHTEDQTARLLPDRAGSIRIVVSAALASLLLLVGPASAHSGTHADVAADNPLANKVREVNARFADVGVATAEGYAPIPCVSGIEGGAMGIHYVNGALIEDGLVDISKPEAVMYEPQADGSMQLVAVEYITTKGRPISTATCSASPTPPTATACRPSTSCMSGPGAPTPPAALPT